MEWISVKDTLPEKGQIVLCIGNGHRASMAYYNGDAFERYIDDVPGDKFLLIHYTKINHWMPLPEPPKE